MNPFTVVPKKLILILFIILSTVFATGTVTLFAMQGVDYNAQGMRNGETNRRFLSTSRSLASKQQKGVNSAQKAGVIIEPTEVTVVEGGSSAVYSLRLTTVPTAVVEITLSTDGTTTVSSSLLTFHRGNWATPQAVTVTAVDDHFVEDSQVGLISHTVSSDDPAYHNLIVEDVKANIIYDDDVAGVDIAPIEITVVEGGAAAAYAVGLASQPTEPVTITLDADVDAEDDEVIVSPLSLLFEPENWNVAQAVVVTAVDDGDVEEPHTVTVNHVASSGDSNYNGLAIDSLTVNVTDNDAPGVLVSPTTVVLSEGGDPNSYSIVLKSRPTVDVVIDISSDAEEATFVPSSLTFTRQNWESAQTVSVQAVDDNVIEGLHSITLTHRITNYDPAYTNIEISDVILAIVDNDTAGVLIAPTFIEVAEGGTHDIYTVSLTSQPDEDVTVLIAADNQLTTFRNGTLTNTLIFTLQNWSVAQTVVVTAVDDVDEEGRHISVLSHSVSSGDQDFDQLPASDVTVLVNDNDIVQVRISPESLQLTEGGETIAYTISLLSQPTSTVTIKQSTEGQTTVYPMALFFEPNNWDAPQAVTVLAVDDDFYEGDHNSTVSHTAISEDPRFDNIAVNTLPISLVDNDTAEVFVFPTTLTVSEGGASESYTLRLSSQPQHPVTVFITSTGQLSATTTSLTFDNLNWHVSQAVDVTAVDDFEIEGTHSGTLVHSASSADENFNSVPISPTLVTIIDDDTAGVLIVPTMITVNEGGAGSSYKVNLTSRPTQTVTVTVNITLTATEQLTVTPQLLTFNSENWQETQAVMVTAVDNEQVNDITSAVISHTVSSDDSQYAALTLLNVAVIIYDDDMADVIIDPAVVNLDEGGTPVTYTMRLASQPDNDVAITAIPDAQTTITPTTLTFTAENWGITQTVSVTAVDDLVGEGLHTGTITHTVSSEDANFNDINISSIIATITDNDVVGVIVTPTLISLREGGAPLSYTIRLTSQPLADVVISTLDDGQLNVMPPILTFSEGNWSLPQSMMLTAVDDELPEGLHNGTVTMTTSSTDPTYDDVTIDPVNAEIIDNDRIEVIITPQELDLSEGGPPLTYTVYLGSKPTATVTVNIMFDSEQVQVNGPDRLFFVPANWEIGQMVSVTAVDNTDIDGQRNSVINHVVTSGDTRYDALAVPDVTAVISDNEPVSVIFLPVMIR